MPCYIFFLCLYVTFCVAENNEQMHNKIIGGRTIDIKYAPYTASLQYNGVHLCGASVIRPAYILTAAHCVEKGTIVHYTVRAGSKFHARGGILRRVMKITSHPYYEVAFGGYDVALIEIAKPFIISSKIISVPLADNEPEEGDILHVTGWGAMREKGHNYAELQSVMVPVISRQKCQRIYYSYTINNAMICAGYESGGRDACQGDSGGPAVSGGKQVGIVSWGVGCGRENSPGVYTNIAYFRRWILSLMP